MDALIAIGTIAVIGAGVWWLNKKNKKDFDLRNTPVVIVARDNVEPPKPAPITLKPATSKAVRKSDNTSPDMKGALAQAKQPTSKPTPIVVRAALEPVINIIKEPDLPEKVAEAPVKNSPMEQTTFKELFKTRTPLRIGATYLGRERAVPSGDGYKMAIDIPKGTEGTILTILPIENTHTPGLGSGELTDSDGETLDSRKYFRLGGHLEFVSRGKETVYFTHRPIKAWAKDGWHTHIAVTFKRK